MRTPLDLPKAHRLLNHGPTTLVAAEHDGRRNVMAAAWVMPLDFDPPKFAAVIAADTFTRKLVEASGSCILSLPTTAQVDLCYAVGTCSGADTDKFAMHGIRYAPASTVTGPLIEGCAAWLECRVLPAPRLAADHDLFVLQCTAAWVEDALWHEGAWRFPPGAPRTVHHLKGGLFLASGDPVQARRPTS